MAVIVEIRAAEGGEDAKLLVLEQYKIYQKRAGLKGFDLEKQDYRPGYLLLHASGPGAEEAFREEAGGHRWQRVPPTERRGRVHTSTVTVAVLEEPLHSEFVVDTKDVEVSFSLGSGAGGQHRQKTETAVNLRHVPTGLVVRVDRERSQSSNLARAMDILRARLKAAKEERDASSRNDKRSNQIGSGMRGCKRRTISIPRDSVVDHITGRRMSYSDYARGA